MRPEHPVVMITGASSGFGEAAARLLAADGYALALGARRVERVRALAEELSAKHGVRVFAGAVDTRDTASVDRFVAASVEALGSLNVVLANAGLARGVDPIASVLEEDWQAMLHTNVEGVIRTLKATLPHVRKSGWGHFLTIGSTAGHWVYEGGGAYCASKHALKALTRTLRLELCGEPIRVTEIDPGMAVTEFSMVRLQDEGKADAVYRGVEPLRAEDVAECVRWAIALPDHVNIDEIIVKCRDQASHNGTKVHRRA
ncbi:SDR family NAD(P)-dependent oxidoreductase [Mesoterricola sediminis]|uniref:Oxidoreductase n=1 Tax=Mesoterricola sediminis TaxID=2927980 RepID=A0AA48KDL9_9BACT|nr:SDR family NAD(P)-dependent oxidoreductase [Mesoterricola sediminis]BDU78469.1 oxidoreductase [Mesoterricola sediminis]